MGSPLDRLAVEYGVTSDSAGSEPATPSPLDQLAAKYGAAPKPASAEQSPLDALADKYDQTLQMVGLSRAATPEEVEAATPTPERTPSGIPPVEADVTAARNGPSVGEPPWWLRLPAKLASGMAQPFIDVLVRPTTEDVARRTNPSMAEIGMMAKAGINVLAPTPEQQAELYGNMAPQSRAHLLLSGAQAAALLGAGPGEAATKDLLEAGAARALGSDAVEGVLNQAALHGTAGALVNAGVGALFDPEHPLRSAAIGAGTGLVLGGVGGAVAGLAAKATEAQAAAETADRAVLNATIRGFDQGPKIVEGGPGTAVLDAAERAAPATADVTVATVPMEMPRPETAPAAEPLVSHEPQASRADAAATFEPNVAAEPITESPAVEVAPDAADRIAPADRVVKNRGEPPAEAAAAADGLAPGSPDAGARQVNRYTDALRRTFNPTARSAGAKTTGLIIRARAAERAMADERAHEALRQFAKTFDGMGDADRLDFIDRIETGREQPTPALDEAAKTMRALLDHARDDIRALGTGKLEHFLTDYFPHIWSDPEEAQRVITRIMGKRSLTGPASFLKQRSIVTIKDGIEAGLTPLTTNPIDLTLLKLREMHRYVMGQKILAEMKSEGLARFIAASQQAPAGYVAISDKVGTVYGPPTVTVTEAYDKIVTERLNQLIDRLGIRHIRKPKIGHGGALGFAEGGSKITTRVGTPLDVVYHELGHALDAKYDLWTALTSAESPAERQAIQKELRALADLRWEGQDASEYFKRYVRNRYEKVAVGLQALMHAPDRMAEVAPTVKAKLTAFLAERPELRDLLDIKPSLVHGASMYEMPVGGLVIRGHYFAPEPVARVLNSYLSAGFAGNPFVDLYRNVGNTLNAASLSLSAFHLGFTSIDAATSQTALGLEQLTSGQVRRGLTHLLTTPAAPFTTMIQGSKVLREYLHPGSQGGDLGAIVDALTAGGGRIRMDQFYRAGASGQFFKTLRESGAAFRQGRLLRGTGRLALAGWKGLGDVLDATAWPVLQFTVPRMKLGVFADLARFELSRLPANASPELIRATMANAWDRVDGRLGEMVYENVFWDRAVKDALFASVRAVGWNLGTIRELGGGLLDLGNTTGRVMAGGPLLTHRAAYVVALTFNTMLLGSIVNYLYTGEAPRDQFDMIYPRTGRLNPDGTEERVELPTYMRDAAGFARHPGRTVENKLHPLVTALADMWQNRDYFGNRIRNEDDPIVQQLAQEATFLAAQFEPIGIEQAREEFRRGQRPATIAGSFIGITPAPREVTRTKAQQRMTELLSRRSPEGATPEAAAQQRARAEVRDALRRGGPEGARALREALSKGTVSAAEAMRMLTGAHEHPTTAEFQELTLPEALEVYGLGTPEERRAWGAALAAKLARMDPSAMTPDEITEVRKGLAVLHRQ